MKISDLNNFEFMKAKRRRCASFRQLIQTSIQAKAMALLKFLKNFFGNEIKKGYQSN